MGREWPSIRVTSEWDSESRTVYEKVSCKVLEGVAKLRLSFQSDGAAVSEPQVGVITKHLSVLLDLEERNALAKASVELGPHLQVAATHDVKARRGDISLVASKGDYSLQLCSPAKGSLKFPLGEVQLEGQQEEDPQPNLALNAILKSHVLGGLCSAQFSASHTHLRYAFKDHQLAFIPSLSLPSNALSFAFKRRFSPSHKLSYWYNFDVNNWSAVYKQTYGKDLKFKAGYDSEVRMAWASLWVGDENGKAKTAPMKMKLQLMLQVPQDDIRSSALMLRVKKRCDI